MKTAALPNPADAIEALTVFVVSTSVLAIVVLFNSYVKDDWYLNHLNSIVSALLAIVIAHRLYLGVAQRGARIAWACALLTVAILTVSQWFEGYTEKLETAIGIEDLDDICL